MCRRYRASNRAVTGAELSVAAARRGSDNYYKTSRIVKPEGMLFHAS